MGDGEMQEGSNWEAAMTAAHYELHQLTAVVDRNRLQQGARTEDTKTLEPLHDKWTSFGWETRRIDGHDHLALVEAMGPSTTGKPVGDRRRHHQGQGRVLHGGPRRVAPQGAHRRPGPRRTRGALRMTITPIDVPTDAPTFDCRVDFADELARLAREDDRIVAVCNDSVGSSNLTGFREEFPDRLFNVGIAEQDLVGVGAGLANAGLIPFVCAAAPFLTGRATEQIKADVAYSQRHVVLCGQSPGMAYGELGPTHHSIEDLSWMRAVAGLPVVVPAGPLQTRAAVRWAAGARTRLLPADPALQGARGLRPRATSSSPPAPSRCDPATDVTIIAVGLDGLPCRLGRGHPRRRRRLGPGAEHALRRAPRPHGRASPRPPTPAASSPSRRPRSVAGSVRPWPRSSARNAPAPCASSGWTTPSPRPAARRTSSTTSA